MYNNDFRAGLVTYIYKYIEYMWSSMRCFPTLNASYLCRAIDMISCSEHICMCVNNRPSNNTYAVTVCTA